MREFCLRLVTTTIEHREKNNIVRNDLMQFLIQLRNNNVAEGNQDADEWRINGLGKALCESLFRLS